MAEKIPADALKAEFTPGMFGLKLSGLTMLRDGSSTNVLHHEITNEQAAWLMEYLSLAENALSLAAKPSRRRKSYPSPLGSRFED